MSQNAKVTFAGGLLFGFTKRSWLRTVDNLRCAKQSLVFLIGCKSQLSKVQPTTHTECCSRRGGESIIERND